MPSLKRGLLLYLSLGLLLTSCRDSVPPKIEVCILDGFGGGDCIETDGSQKYRFPSQMANYWATGEADEANYSSWCYATSVSTTKAAMSAIKFDAVAQSR